MSGTGGLGRFVGREGRGTGSNSLPLGGQPQSARAAAAAFKVSTKEIKRVSTPSTHFTNPTPEPQYPLNGYQPTAPTPPYKILMKAPLAPAREPSRDRLDDTTAGSDFDKTLSERHFKAALEAVPSVQGHEQGYEQEYSDSNRALSSQSASANEFEDDEDYPEQHQNGNKGILDAQGYTHTRFERPEEYQSEPVQPEPPHTLRRQRDVSPIVQRQDHPLRLPAQASGIAGRFTQSMNVPIRSSQHEHIPIEQPQHPKKRSRSPEFPRHGPNRRHETDRHSFRTEPEVPRVSGFFDTQQNDRQGEAEDVSKTASPDRTPRRSRQPRSNHSASSQHPSIDNPGTQPQPVEPPQPIVADYDDEALKSMTYAQVEADNWEMSRKGPANNDNRPLAERLQELVAQIEPEDIGRRDNSHGIEFFSSISTAEWEQSGEWFVHKFADLMKAFMEKRTQRRLATEKFESELRAREKVIRGKSDKLDKMFKDMRASGEDMLRGKV